MSYTTSAPLFAASLAHVRIETFLSHSWGNGRRDSIHSLIQNTGEWVKGIDYQDHSITSAHPIHENDPLELYRAICRVIAKCDVFLVPAGMEGAYSQWMDREIDAAVALAKPIIAVVPNGAERRWSLACDMASEIVGWRGTSIREAILKWMPAHTRTQFARQQARVRRPLSELPPPGLNEMVNTLHPRSSPPFGVPAMLNALASPPPLPRRRYIGLSALLIDRED